MNVYPLLVITGNQASTAACSSPKREAIPYNALSPPVGSEKQHIIRANLESAGASTIYKPPPLGVHPFSPYLGSASYTSSTRCTLPLYSQIQFLVHTEIGTYSLKSDDLRSDRQNRTGHSLTFQK